MTLATIKKRLIQLENSQPAVWARVHSWDFEKYEDFLVEAKKAYTYLKETPQRPGSEIVAIGIVPPADELRACLQRMEAAGIDEELIEDVRDQLQRREEEERERLLKPVFDKRLIAVAEAEETNENI